MSSVVALNANDDVRDATRSALIVVSALMISSAMPSVKYPFSRSALMSANGSTAIDFGAAAGFTVVWSPGVDTFGQTSALANSPEVGNRSRGSFDSAFVTASSISSGTLGSTLRSDGTGSVNRLLSTDCAVEPVNAFFPDRISYSMHARLY